MIKIEISGGAGAGCERVVSKKEILRKISAEGDLGFRSVFVLRHTLGTVDVRGRVCLKKNCGTGNGKK